MLEEKEFFLMEEDIVEEINSPLLEAVGSRLYYRF
jgi:hypothetical protein